MDAKTFAALGNLVGIVEALTAKGKLHRDWEKPSAIVRGWMDEYEKELV